MPPFISGPGAVPHYVWIVEKGVNGGFYADGIFLWDVHSPIGSPQFQFNGFLAPAHVYGPGGVGTGIGTYLLTYDGQTVGGNEVIRIIRIDDPFINPEFVIDEVSVGDIDSVGSADGFPDLPNAGQPQTFNDLWLDGRKVLDAVWRDGSIYLVTTVLGQTGPDAGQSTAHWIRLDASAVTDSSDGDGLITFAEGGDVGAEDLGPGTFTYFPSVDVNAAGDMRVGFCASSENLFAGAYSAYREASDPPGTIRATETVRAGDDWYVRGLGGFGNPWGTYTGISVDPNDDDSFWVLGLYAQTQGTPLGFGLGRWGTAYRKFFELPELEPAPPFLTKWGSPGSQPGEFAPIIHHVLVDDCGDVYVADPLNNRIQKFDENGNFLLEWGQPGSGPGEFTSPTCLAIDRNDRIYVGEAGGGRIQRFDRDGNFISQWGTPGTGPGQIDGPSGIAISPLTNTVFIAEATNDRVQAFDTTGVYLFGFTPLTQGVGQISRPFDVTVTPSGDLYVLDELNRRVLRYDGAGTYIEEWGQQGTQNGDFESPRALDSDADGNLYISDYALHRLQKFDSQGCFLTAWGEMGSGDGEFDSPFGVGYDDRRGVVYTTEQGNLRVQKFGLTNSGILPFVLSWGTPGAGPGEFDQPIGIDVDDATSVYVADRNNDRVQKFHADGTYLLEWGSQGSGNGEFALPQDVAVDQTGAFVYVTDLFNDRVQKFDSDGNYLLQWGSTGAGPGQFTLPLAVTVGPGGEVYVSDGNDRIQKFDSNGGFLLEWGSMGSGAGQFSTVIGLDTDAGGNVYASDQNNTRVQKFDSSGGFLLEFGTPGFGPGEFGSVTGVAVDGFGNVYVGDGLGDRVKVFDTTGNYVGQWGCSGYGDGEFQLIALAANDQLGDLYVADANLNRVQRFGNGLVDVESVSGTPGTLTLHHAVPNPARGSSLIAFDLPKPSIVSLSVYDVRGRLVRSAYENTAFAAGSHRWVWDGRNANGSRVSTGIYFYSLVTEQGTQSKKLVVVE